MTTADDYDLDLRYANSQGGDGQNTTGSLDGSVDDRAAQPVTQPLVVTYR